LNEADLLNRTLCSLLTLAVCAGCQACRACVPLLVGGAVVGTALMATDRRTTGTQVEDEGIELRCGQPPE
jgi:osmotically-inducible protein OsmY